MVGFGPKNSPMYIWSSSFFIFVGHMLGHIPLMMGKPLRWSQGSNRFLPPLGNDTSLVSEVTSTDEISFENWFDSGFSWTFLRKKFCSFLEPDSFCWYLTSQFLFLKKLLSDSKTRKATLSMATMPWTPWMDATLPMGRFSQVPQKFRNNMVPKLSCWQRPQKKRTTKIRSFPRGSVLFFQRRKVRWEDDDNC